MAARQSHVRPFAAILQWKTKVGLPLAAGMDAMDAEHTDSPRRPGSLTPAMAVCWLTVAAFVLLIGFIFGQDRLPDNGRYFKYIFFTGIGVLTGLGIVLIILAARLRQPRRLRLALLWTGIAAVGMPVSAVLHNLVYGLMIVLFGDGFWGQGGDEPVFFLLAVIGFPLVLIVSAICTVVFYVKYRRLSGDSPEGRLPASQE